MPIDTTQFKNFNEANIIAYYQKNQSIPNRLTWTKQKLLMFTNTIANQLEHNRYHREFKNDLIIITELKILIPILEINIFFKKLQELTMLGLTNFNLIDTNLSLKDVLAKVVNLTTTITDSVTDFRLSICGNSIISELRSAKIINFATRYIKSFQKLPSIDQQFIINKLNSKSSWLNSYKNFNINYFYQDTQHQVAKHDCYTYKNTIVNDYELMLIDVFDCLLNKQSFQCVQRSLTLLYQLQLLTPELLIRYYKHCLKQALKKYELLDFYKYYQHYDKYDCYFNLGKNRHYYHELSLSKFISRKLNCARRRPFSLNFYFQILALLPK